MNKTMMTEEAKKKRNEYCREYYKKWRADNKDKKREYNVRYWKKKLSAKAE